MAQPPRIFVRFRRPRIAMLVRRAAPLAQHLPAHFVAWLVGLEITMEPPPALPQRCPSRLSAALDLLEQVEEVALEGQVAWEDSDVEEAARLHAEAMALLRQAVGLLEWYG